MIAPTWLNVYPFTMASGVPYQKALAAIIFDVPKSNALSVCADLLAWMGQRKVNRRVTCPKIRWACPMQVGQ